MISDCYKFRQSFHESLSLHFYKKLHKENTINLSKSYSFISVFLNNKHILVFWTNLWRSLPLLLTSFDHSSSLSFTHKVPGFVTFNYLLTSAHWFECGIDIHIFQIPQVYIVYLREHEEKRTLHKIEDNHFSCLMSEKILE